jgi:hypothetical protein
MLKRVCFLLKFPGLVLLASVVLVVSAPSHPAPSGQDAGILTFHGDAARTGWNSAERVLTPNAVRSGAFKKRWVAAVDGEMYAQPLVVPGVAVGGAAHVVVYVVTERDRIYALDATDGKRLWGPVSLGTAVSRGDLPCGNIDPVGITSTPVIDRASSTLYIVGLTTPDGGRTKVYKATALDLSTGSVRQGWPVDVAPPPSSGKRFDPSVQQQRGALALLRGVVYVPFGGYWGDCGDYHGWVAGLPVSDPRKQEAFATPTGRMGGIWATGGLAADPEGNLYAATGNSDSRGPVDFSNSVIRLSTSPLRFSGAARDFFAPSNFVGLNETDTDLGSDVPLVLPDQPGSTTPHLVFIAGKQGVGYLINRDSMGGVSKGDGITGEGLYSQCVFGACRDGGLQVASATAYWDGGSAGRLILVPGRAAQPAPCRGTGGIVALRLGVTGSRASVFDVTWCSSSMRAPGAPSVSSAGADGGLVWVVDTSAAVLYALDARTGVEVYASRGTDVLGGAHQFITPAVWDGHVYVPAGHEVIAYGLK